MTRPPLAPESRRAPARPWLAWLALGLGFVALAVILAYAFGG